MERGRSDRLENDTTALALTLLQNTKTTKELTDSCHSRTLIVDIFGADVTHHPGSHGLKEEVWRGVRTLCPGDRLEASFEKALLHAILFFLSQLYKRSRSEL